MKRYTTMRRPAGVRAPVLALFALVALGLPLGGCGGEEQAGAPGKGKGPPPARVRVEPVGQGTLTARRTFLGYASPLSTTTLAAGVSGTVSEVGPRVGDRVEAGATLVKLETDLIEPRLSAARAAERQAAAELAQARRERDRAAKLPHPVITDAERERFESRVDALEAAVRARRAEAERLRAELRRHTVEAPFAGVVRARTVEPGMWVNPGQAMLGLVSADALQIEVDVDAALLDQIRPGGAATLVGPTEAPITVKGVVPALDETTRTARIRLEPDAPVKWLVAGSPVDVRFEWQTAEGLLVSRDALVRGPSGVRIVKAVDGKAVPQSVEVGETAGGQAIVRAEGLAPGDQVITRGNERIRPGQPLQIVDDAPAGQPGGAAKGPGAAKGSGAAKAGGPGAPAARGGD